MPRIPWEGGPAYWAQFPKAAAGGWTSPNFFPIAIFHNSVDAENQVKFDKAYGINSYIYGYPDYIRYEWLKNNGMFWLAAAPNSTFPSLTASAADSSAWPGMYLDDEPDGRFGGGQNDLDHVLNLLNKNPENGRFRSFNFTGIVASDYGAENNKYYIQMVNSYRGPVSLDAYWYTTSNCSPSNPAYTYLLYGPSDPAHCRTASSYGRAVKSIRERAYSDGVPQPVWNFIENLNGHPGNGAAGPGVIQPGQLKGAAMSSIINEARGLMWFNTSLAGNCQTGLALRFYQAGLLPCAGPSMEAMKEINLEVQRLAPIINTQSYQYTFGPKLDTMLKWYNGSAYVFAMINGESASVAGARTFALPAGLTGASVEVVGENRTIAVSAGQFVDTFAAEYSYHVYKITP